MAGHSKFKNIQHRKGAQDKKRAKIFTRLVREIIVSSKIGGTDPSSNPRLRTALVSARAQNLPKDRINKALSTRDDDNANDYSEIRYEGFLGGGIALIIETLTDNKNRTVASIRSILNKAGGNLGEQGSVSFLFDKIGEIIFNAKCQNDFDKFIEDAIESGADDIIEIMPENEEESKKYVIYCESDDYNQCLEKITNIYKEEGDLIESNIIWKAKNIIDFNDDEKKEKILKVIEKIEDDDDVQNVFLNIDI
ncbi:MAG TPA: YebC/PmpR family DNA-binding transcriptional regulator [Candidatus Megaira endosymbiont of Hartmannula sinica]|nr:YebC/PmpR family DNA-binding transcriptional regulator [Candidatus Megaera endosymbiont of Hartmannula sinica]